MATLGASYHDAAGLAVGTQLSSSDERLRHLDSWVGAKAIVLPVCSGKSTICQRFGGYDIDDIVADGSTLDDPELQSLYDARDAAYFLGDRSQLPAHNALMLKRAHRFFSLVEPDSNPLVVYVHTVEMAVALGLQVIAVHSLRPETIAHSSRFKNKDEAPAITRVAKEQARANELYCTRHNMKTPVEAYSYSDLTSRVIATLLNHKLLDLSGYGNYFHQQLETAKSEREQLDVAEHALDNLAAPMWVHAVAARRIRLSLGDASTQESHMHHNHVAWARIVHFIFARVAKPQRSVPANATEEQWVADYPMGPGHSHFALIRVSDWLRRTEAASFNEPAHYRWFKQLSSRPASCHYERLAGALAYGEILTTVPHHQERLNRLPLGLLDDMDYQAATKEIHLNVRVGCTFLGAKLAVQDLTLYTYLDCLAGRLMGTTDPAAELADHTGEVKPKQFYINGGWSTSEFDARFSVAVGKAYDTVMHKLRAGMNAVEEHLSDFESFLQMRKTWSKPGSATGAPKTDLYLKVPRDHILAAEEIAQDLGDALVIVLRSVRLNKTALMEFSEFPDLVKQALADFKPNSFSKHFNKREPGKPQSRFLYPSHLLNYVVTSIAIGLFEKGARVPNSRFNADSDAQREDHWLWRETLDCSLQLMLDYTNFQETHEIKHMQEVMGGLKQAYAGVGRLTPDLTRMIDWVVESYNNICVEFGGELVLWTHGLMSGWRATTMINSVSNVAYLDVIGQQVAMLTNIPTFRDCESGGDDVAGRAASIYHAAVILRVGAQMGFSFKAIKQMLGHRYSEFFRLFVGPEGVYGSVCRMLGSAMSGQWSNSIMPKFIEPASKLSSVVDVVRKAGRRTLLNMSFMEKLYMVAFDKWATDAEGTLVDELVHGTRSSGGLGIPKPDGSVYELESGPPVVHEPMEFIGIPHDASLQHAKMLCAEAKALLPDEFVLPEQIVAQTMAQSSYTGALAQAIGPRKVRVRTQRRTPTVKRTKNVSPDQFQQRPSSGMFKIALDHNNSTLKVLNRLGKKYDQLATVVKSNGKLALCSQLCLGSAISSEMLHFWKEGLTLYGCATYMLTEDYYEDVVLLSLLCTPVLDDDNVSWIAGQFATGLSNEGYMYY